jgi:hypothetical protein
MQASERLAEAQEARRKDLVALAVMRRELLGSFAAERSWLTAAHSWMHGVHGPLAEREGDLDALVMSGVHTEPVITELATVRAERKLFALAMLQADAQLARIAENETASEYQVASEAYDREPDGASMRDVARLRSAATRTRRATVHARDAAREALIDLDIVPGMGEATALYAFLTSGFEGDTRSAARVQAVRSAQVQHELAALPQFEAAWKAGLRHPVQFMRARRSTGVER